MQRVIFPTDPLLGQPVRSLQTMLRLLAQEDAAIPTVIPDGIFGKSTLQSVSAFQRRYGLPVTGVANEATWQALRSAYRQARVRQEPASPLQIYLEQPIDQNDLTHILLLQAMLAVITGFYPHLPAVTPTGVYDETTRAAVQALQELGELTSAAGSQVDKETWRLLTHLYRAVTTQAAAPLG